MGSPIVTFDPSTAIQLNRTDTAPVAPVAPDPATALQGALSYGVQQNPQQYAKRLLLQKQLGVPPVVSAGNEEQLQQAADLNSVNATQFAAQNPRTTAWASNPDNAAVAGVDGVQNLGTIEQHAAVMRAYTPSFGEQVADKLSSFGSWMMDGTISPEQIRQNFSTYPLMGGLRQIPRAVMNTASSTATMLGNVDSMVGLHGSGPTKQNLLQRIGASLDPADPGEGYVDSHIDSGEKFIGPLLVGGAAGYAFKTAGLVAGMSEKAASVFSGLGVGGVFDADQGGQTYTAVSAAGGSDADARHKANLVAAINAPANALFGATGIEALEKYPWLTAGGIGAITGASGQFAQNQITGRPWNEGMLPAIGTGAAVQLGLHAALGFAANFGAGADGNQAVPAPTAVPPEFSSEFKSSPFLTSLAGAVSKAEETKLSYVSPDKFHEALQTTFDGDESLRIPSDQFSSYFKNAGADPAQMAESLGSTNYPEAVVSGGDVEVPKAGFLAMLDPEHQKALLPDVVDPSTGLSARQYQDGRAELEQWATGGGAAKTEADMAAADAETAATPEYQDVKEQLRQRYADAGETPEVAETLATKDANAYSNLARNAGMKPDELLRLYNPKVVSGEAPGAPTRPLPNEQTASPIEFKAPEEQPATNSASIPGGADRDAASGSQGSDEEADGPLSRPAFKKWFGQSNAVDEDGKPAVLYHGTGSSFDVFDHQKSASRDGYDTGDFGRGFYFADKPEIAESYAASAASKAGFEYTGPTATEEEVRAVAADENNSSAMQRQAREVAMRMWKGETFASAIGKEGSPGLADLFGGEVKRQDTPQTRAQIMPVYLQALRTLEVGEDHEELHNLAMAAEGESKRDAWGKLSPTEQSDLIQKAGYDSIHDKGYGQWSIYDPTKVKSATGNIGSFDGTDPNILHQSSEQGTQGWFRVLPDGSYEIGKTKIGDLSTFVHEPAHAYLKILGDLAGRDAASDTLKGDYAKVLDFLGAKDGEPFTREQQEKWGRANEQYLREGKAPSSSLKGAFQRFAIWLGTVYKHASDLGVNLSDNIRGVFDRLYAAESGVEKADAEGGPKLFSSAEEAGWTDEEFKNYADAKGMGVEQAKSEILGKLNEAAVREKSERWRAEERNVRTAVTEQVDQSPEYTAIRSLRRGTMDDGTPLTMDRDALLKQFGEDRVAELQKQHPGLYRNEGGIEPETAAEILGFSSADHMMTTLEDTQRRSDVIDKGTRYYMSEKHGDIRYDGTLDDQARLALENDKKSDSLYKELQTLKKQVADLKSKASGQKDAMRSIDIAPIATYREAAHQMIESKPVADLQPSRYLDASRKYSREAFDALRKGDANGAAEAKHKELMNHFLFREASNAKEYLGRFESYAKRMQNKGVQGSIGKAGSDYLSQFNKLLFRYGIGNPPAEAPDRSLAEWANVLFAEGKEAAIDPSIYDESRVVNYRQASVAEVRNLHDALINIRHLAGQELSMDVNGRKVEFSAAMERMNAQARESLTATPRPVFDENRTTGQKVSDLVNRGTALLKRTEFLMKQLDGGTSGPWHDNLWHLASDAQGKEDELQHAVTQQVGEALQNMPKEQRAQLLDKVTIDGVTEPLTRRTMMAMAFNMGNEGNLDRLEKTFISHGWEPRAIDQIKGELTREEWQFVQKGWDSLKPLGQEQSALEKRLTGLPPVMVKPTPLHLELKDGSTMDLDGGYYPIVMDSRYSTRGAQQDTSMTAQNLMESGYGRATTSRGNMKERTGFGGPLLLDYEQVLTQHTAKVVKDISHREFMLTANKMLMDPTLRQTMRETVGQGNEAQMMPWLRTIINNANGSSVQGLGDVSRAMSGLRTNVVKAALGFKFSTLLLQLTHASSVFLHTSPSSYAQAMIDFMAHPSDMTQQIKDLSPNEMSARGDNLDRDMRKVLRDGVGKTSVGDMWAKAGMYPVQMMDHVLSFPLWLSVYRDALADHAGLAENMRSTDDEAKYQAMQKADGAVRMGLGSNAPKDLAPIMRNHDLTKLLTTMGGFHNLKYNQMADVASGYQNGGGLGKLTYGMIMAGIIPAVMGPLITGRGPKDGENVAGWAAKKALLFPFETVALLNIGVEALENHGDMRYSPIASMFERTAKDGAHALADGDNKDWTGMGLNTLQTAMEGMGISGTDQAFKVGRYVRQTAQGKIADPNPWDAVAGSAPHK